MKTSFVVAVDGPSSSGKGTIAKLIANKFKLPYLNTGALYRRLALDAVNIKLDLESDIEEIVKLIPAMNLEDLESDDLHNEVVGSYASMVAKNEKIRKALRHLQVDFASQKSGAVLDGRDIGTIICPGAEFKFFITASLEERTNRRFSQLRKNNFDVTKEKIFSDLKARDDRDSNRSASPLVIAEDAIEIDTSNMSIDEVCNKVLNIIESK